MNLHSELANEKQTQITKKKDMSKPIIMYVNLIGCACGNF
jgi:hypothetical protein